MKAAVVRFFGLASCGHWWRREFVDGLCFDCKMREIEQRVNRQISDALISQLIERGPWRHYDTRIPE